MCPRTTRPGASSIPARFPPRPGQSFYERAKRAIEEADEAEAAARGANASLSGQLRISAAVTFARLHVVPRLAAFLAQHPALQMDVMLDDRNIDLIDSGVDVALRMGALEDSTLIARRIEAFVAFVEHVLGKDSSTG